MNYAKKLFKNKLDYLILIFLIVSLLFILIIFGFRNSQKLEFLTIPKSYSVVLEENDRLKLNVKCNRDDTIYLNKDMIQSCYLFDNLTKDSYLVELQEVTQNSDFKYQQDSYYDYDLKIKIPFISTSVVDLDNFYLVLNYLNDECLNLKMGSLSLISSKDFKDDILIKSLQGIVNKENNQDLLKAIVIKMENINPEIVIKSINTVSNTVFTNLKETIILNKDFKNDDNLEDILGKEYDINKIEKGNININLNGELTLLIPLSYKNKGNIKTLGFIINYTLNNEDQRQLIYPFKFFENTDEEQVEKMIYDFH